jgi:FkbM family methyltransferase
MQQFSAAGPAGAGFLDAPAQPCEYIVTTVVQIASENPVMTALATHVRPLAVSAMRCLPRLRGWGRCAAAMNRLLINAGADPIALARMTGGYSMIVDCRIFSHGQALFGGRYARGIVSTLIEYLGPGGTALDVGAQIGFYAVPLARAARERGGRVIAVEPLAQNAAWLRRNLTLNELDSIVTVVEAALSSAGGEARLSLREDFLQGAAVGNASIEDPRTDSPAFERVSIRLETLDALWPTLGCQRLDVVKVDIEGHEDRFLTGGKNTIAAQRPVILIEINRWFYERRGIDFDTVIAGLIPPDYIPCSIRDGHLRPLSSLRECAEADALLMPREKLGVPR